MSAQEHGLDSSPFRQYLEALREELAAVTTGSVADYIPELARASPATFGIAVATVSGAVYEAGDTRTPFTIQSISKPLTFGLALEDLGERAVRARIGVEPTGEAFNSITLDAAGRPLNPMVNAGAITATSLVKGKGNRSAFQRILDLYSAYAGRPLAVDEATARSESRTGYRNRAIANLLAGAGTLSGDPADVVERYFRQCAVRLDCRDAAIVAATLAGGGINPVTRKSVAGVETVKRVLVVMATCGMYDGAGEWMYTVGLPAKSGVSGTIVAVLPGSLGIAVHSPLLDGHGNSVRGIRACRRLAGDLDLHLIRVDAPPNPVRSSFTAADRRSKRVRSERELAVLERDGKRARVLELQNELSFPAVEVVMREVLDEAHDLAEVVLDLRRVDSVPKTAIRFLAELAVALATRGIATALSGTRAHAEAARAVARRARTAGAAVDVFGDLDAALEWCEDRVLAAASAAEEPRRIALPDHNLLAGLDEPDVALVRRLLQRRRFPAGAEVLRPGDPGDAVYLVTRGRLSVIAQRPDGPETMVATLVPGMVFGELAFIDRRPHRGLVRADTAVECYVLRRDAVDGLREASPDAQVTLLLNLARQLAARADAMRNELALRT